MEKLYNVRLFFREDIEEKCKEIEKLRVKYKVFNICKKKAARNDGLFYCLVQIDPPNPPVFCRALNCLPLFST